MIGSLSYSVYLASDSGAVSVLLSAPPEVGVSAVLAAPPPVPGLAGAELALVGTGTEPARSSVTDLPVDRILMLLRKRQEAIINAAVHMVTRNRKVVPPEAPKTEEFPPPEINEPPPFAG